MQHVAGETITPRAAVPERGSWLATNWHQVALAAILVLAAVLRFSNLTALGYVNGYYTAAVKSMLQSWHNFFFVAAEPGGAVSVDKPPIGLWLQTASAYVFGVNTFGVLFPQLAAGVGSVALLYVLVSRAAGRVAGLVAALALAVAPVAIATDRNNTIDSTLIFTLLLAAWAFIKATETRRLRWLLVGALLVGIGFNIKMLQAYLPLPAFFALYFLGAEERIWPKLGKLVLTGIVVLVVSLSWAIAVDLTPADQRPYVGSSSNNSELELIFGYNGIMRLLGRQGGAFPGAQAGQAPQNGRMPPNGPNNTRAPNTGLFPGGRNGGPPQGGFAGGPGGVGGMFNTGTPGVLRLFSTPLSHDVGWLLPLGVFSMALLALRTRLRWPLEPKHQSLVLWGGWLMTTAVFFSIAGFFHEYYLTILAVPLAAVVGLGVGELRQMRGERPWLAATLLIIAVSITVAFQAWTVVQSLTQLWWLPVVVLVLLSGVAMMIVALRTRRGRLFASGFGTIILAAMIVPAVWSMLTMLHPNANASLPGAYNGDKNTFSLGGPGRFSAGAANGGTEAFQINQSLLDFLQANTQNTKYLMAVPSSMQGANYIIATGRPVLYMGGFSGQDPVVDATKLEQMVQSGDLRYIYWSANGGRGPQSGGSDISSFVSSNCSVVQGFDTMTQNSGNPDGTGAIAPNADGTRGPAGGFAGMRVTLYDCGG